MSSELIWPIVLQLIGVAVIIAEFILPSAGLLTVAALGVIAYSLYLVFVNVSTQAGFIFVVIDILLLPILVILGMKLLAASPVTLRTTLSSKESGTAQSESHFALQGTRGTALTPLRPAGSALLNGKKYDVISRGEFLEKGSALVVTKIDGNRIVVKPDSE